MMYKEMSFLKNFIWRCFEAPHSSRLRMLTNDMTIINNDIQSCNLFANECHFLRYDQFMAWLPSLRNIDTVFPWQTSSVAARRERMERQRKREEEVDAYQAEIYVTAHARMTECVSVCVHPDIHVWSRGFGHLLVGRDPLCVHERRRSELCAPEKKSLAKHGGAEGDEERWPASFADWRAPESLRCARETEQ